MKRASKACVCCRARKVRCDVLQTGLPCTKCRADGFDCSVRERKKRRRKAEAGGTSSSAIPNTIPGSGSLPHHVALHQIPHYPFFRDFNNGNDRASRIRPKGQSIRLPPSICCESSDRESDDLQFLRHRGALDLPPRPFLEEFVSTYFTVFHPFFPIVDKPAFLKQYRESDEVAILSGRGPSLLLLQAIVFTASASVQNEVLDQLNFPSRKQARKVLHRRIRYLYDFDYEHDGITTIQALLLMSHYYPSMVEQKHTWFWAQQATGLAQGAGLHRDPGPVPQRKLWARIWWACLCRDRLIALGTGRPMHINSLDCSVPMLTTADLAEEGDDDNDRQVKAIFIEFARLCQYMEGVLSLPNNVTAAANSLPDQIALCETTLDRWLENLVPEAQRRDARETRDTCALYRAVLHMIYNIVVITLHQSYNVLGETRTQVPLPRVQAAAEDSTGLAMDLIQLDLVMLSPTICVTAILPPLIIHLLCLRFNSQRSIGPSDTYHYDNCMAFLQQLGDIYWHASFYHEFFELAASPQGQPNSMRDHDPLVAFLSDNLPAKLPSSNRPTEPHVREEGSVVSKVSKDRAANAAHHVASESHLTVTDAASGAPPTGDTSASEDGNGDFLGYLAGPFEDWLEDLGYFHNSFPSA
ncbi:transcriptional regulator family: Fungal Specific TF [Purpureocillium lilacinum]|uniref:Transcriptional regulator family: Fungal Specific TF n=1 Tax=Purpureocillium lilacinum TaxID=33203 RepID=A0ABR0BI27_PURLI|nr:transcriptional regulator family: Fungal Specific TF [Purpureocillium lilacinum]